MYTGVVKGLYTKIMNGPIIWFITKILIKRFIQLTLKQGNSISRSSLFSMFVEYSSFCDEGLLLQNWLLTSTIGSLHYWRLMIALYLVATVE